MAQIYSQKVTSTGAGRDGHVAGDGGIDFEVRPPKENVPGAVNPESLLAAAWAACFNGALRLILEKAGVEDNPEIDAEVALNDDPAGPGFRLSGTITARFKNDPVNKQELVDKAHEFCPFSKALRGEFDARAVAAA